MDKVTLTKEQLTILKRFIESRGFREPLIVMEVLDHFACLVEEKLQANPTMSLEEAMREAHASFGVMGFKTLADAAERERSKRYNKEFKKHLRKILTNPAILIILGLIGSLVFKLYYLVQPIDLGWPLQGTHILSAALLAIYFIGSMAVLRKMPDVKKRYQSGKATWVDNGYSWVLFIIVTSFPNYAGEKLLWLFAGIAGLFVLITLVMLVAQYRAMADFTNRDKHIRDSYLTLE